MKLEKKHKKKYFVQIKMKTKKIALNINQINWQIVFSFFFTDFTINNNGNKSFVVF